MDQEEEYDFNTDQLEVLESGVCAFKYFPKVVVKKIFKELRAMKTSNSKPVSRNQISDWLKSSQTEERIPYEISTAERLEELQGLALEERLWSDLNNTGEEERQTRVRFAAREEVKLYEKNLPASASLVGDEEED